MGRKESEVDVTAGFYQSLLNAHSKGEAMVPMVGVVSDDLRDRALIRRSAQEDQKKALAEQYLADMDLLGKFRVEVDKTEGSDLGTYWYVRSTSD